MSYISNLYYMTHLQVRHLDTSEKSELHKLQQLKDEQGSLSIFLNMYLL